MYLADLCYVLQMKLYRHIAPRLTNSSVCHPSFELHVQWSGGTLQCLIGRVCWQVVPEALYSSMKYIS